MIYYSKQHDPAVCPECGVMMEEIWENQGFTAPDPEYWEVTGYKCKVHGVQEPVFDRRGVEVDNSI